MFDRRQFIVTASALGLVPAFGSVAFAPAALAQDVKVDVAELMKPGPLPEKVLGPETAKVTIVEYASMTCGHCANFHNRTLPHIKKTYIETGQVRMIFREFALDPVAAAVSMLARCAPEEKYHDVVAAFFETQATWARAENIVGALRQLSLQLGFTQETFNACLTNQTLLDGVNAVKVRGETAFKVTSTPTFFINGTMYRGAMSAEEFDKILEPLLKG
jgi:protein-disulfide isomerase